MTPLLDAPDRPTHLRFAAGGRAFDLPIDEAGEVVVPPTLVARVPRTRAPILGAANVRGRVIVLVDLAGLAGLAASAPDPASRRAVLLEGTALALMVDEVTGFSAAASEDAECLGAADLLARVERLLHPAPPALRYLSPPSDPLPPEPTWPSAS